MQKPKKGTGKLTQLRKKPGMSNAFKDRPGPFAGPEKTFPINDISHARNALARAHFAKDPASVKRKVLEKYPELRKK